MAPVRWVALRVVDEGARRLLPPSLEPEVAFLRGEFPSIAFVTSAEPAGPRTLVVVARAWEEEAFDFWRFDRLLDELAASGPFGICIVGTEARIRRLALEVLTRAQRLVGRRNDASSGAAFDRALEVHASMHDLRKPLVRADFDHARDVWQWILRLDSSAPASVQLAGLFHDVERLASEANARVEHEAPDYQAFKDAHARRGAEMTRSALVGTGLSDEAMARAAALVACHERKDLADRDARLLADADALSFFSMNSAGYRDYFGEEQTRAKIRYTLGRLSDEHRPRLADVRLRHDVRALLESVLDEIAGPRSAGRGAE